MFDWLWPESISNATTVFLIFFSCITSAITASLGAGGGVLLLATMAMVLPPAVIIPVHGIVQLGSNLNRALMTLKDVDWRLLGVFALGSALGAWLASMFLVELPIQTTQLTIAALILFLCWGPPYPTWLWADWALSSPPPSPPSSACSQVRPARLLARL